MDSFVHQRTPSLTVHESRGLPVRQVAYLRVVADGPVETLITRQQHDGAGRLLEQWDPRPFGVAPNLATVYRLSGEPLKVDSVDAGWRLSLPGLAGEELQRWDQRGSHWRTTYDRQLRPIAVEENGQPNVETFSYADDSADPAFNLRGQLTGQLDRSGTLSFDSYSLLGQPLRETRTLAESIPYRSSRIYSPLGTVLSQTDAGEHQQQSRYDIAGQLKQVELRIKGSPNWQSVLKDAQYNAAGQIIEQRAGNEVLSTWTYDPADGRLATQRAQKNAELALQDLQYFYDRVGNITRLEDHTFQPIFFANQLVDGHRDFTYDSLYRLTRASGYDDAPPSDVPGRPLPGDPNNRLNYTQHYEYDAGNNLIELRHVRAGASHTRGMFIDPASNRGVRWKPGDPDPVFNTLFDRHGNLQALQPGQALQWNSLDQLEAVTLVNRDNGPNDQEFYRYSQGVRVYKRHETHTSSLTHFQEVIYLPGLEIRTRDNGEELHVITLPGGHGSVRCLHWVSGQPANIAADQVRYSLDDHLGSSTLELDQQAQVISQEGYYPFGATAWYARGSAVDVDYKTIRYSGKEMDDSGLYYYGARYYAPWLQRWVSADPAGAVDGLNLYAMVGNNPLLYIDKSGTSKAVFELAKDFVGVLGKAKNAADQIHNLATEFDGLVPEGADIAEVRQNMTLGKFLLSKHGVKSILKGAIAGSTVASAIGSVVPGVGTGIGAAIGMFVGAIAMPLLRYYFFKKGLKLAETLHTQEIKNGLNTAVDTTNKVIDGAKSIANGGRDLIDKIKNFADTINAYPTQMQDLFYKQLEELTSERQRDVMKLLNSGIGIDPFAAITQVLETAQTIGERPTEAASASQRLAQLADEVANPVSEKPIPKPRKLIQKLQRRNSESIA
ncbi:RHS repeat-associated protein [Pseudomonas sp. 478]|uniref:RHS repeat-associated core domain-containing protein n=1 Tax=unclassified Pseudomonas TaxID=196821 RepID=UPI000DAE5D62|nr:MULTISPECIES: RHS repeat-associated core domain-containing protein [unclassified Pseudomonas]PZW91083.1 RHS repeat-associated protein [Pseudomonas sp. 478]TCV47620.1 insecticidal toxin complex protein TccC [Pseudomonas sp. 460]